MMGSAAIQRILVLEDEASIADTLAIILSTRGYEARVAYSAESAIEIISNWAPDLAIVDVMLPKMNGIDFSIVLKSNYSGCAILLFSGQPDTTALIEEAFKKGYSFEVLAKPLHPAFVLDRVKSLLTPEFGTIAEA